MAAALLQHMHTYKLDRHVSAISSNSFFTSSYCIHRGQQIAATSIKSGDSDVPESLLKTQGKHDG